MRTKRITITVCGISIAAIFAFTIYSEIQNRLHPMSEIAKCNLEILMRSEDDDFTRSDCLGDGGNWNMASICMECGFETATCKIAGKISCFGITLEGSYEKGKKYSIPWARYQCQSAPTNCCKKQGMYTGDTKLA